jgi:hypothetical protein
MSRAKLLKVMLKLWQCWRLCAFRYAAYFFIAGSNHRVAFNLSMGPAMMLSFLSLSVEDRIFDLLSDYAYARVSVETLDVLKPQDARAKAQSEGESSAPLSERELDVAPDRPGPAVIGLKYRVSVELDCDIRLAVKGHDEI